LIELSMISGHTALFRSQPGPSHVSYRHPQNPLLLDTPKSSKTFSQYNGSYCSNGPDNLTPNAISDGVTFEHIVAFVEEQGCDEDDAITRLSNFPEPALQRKQRSRQNILKQTGHSWESIPWNW
jgi:hypothetical protein